MIGLASIGDPFKLAFELVSSREDKERRAATARRCAMYTDDLEAILFNEAAVLFREPAVLERLAVFLRMAGANSLLKRVVDEVCRPVYAQAPRRIVTPPLGQTIYRALGEEMDINGMLDLVCRLVLACNDVFLFLRSVGGRVVLDVITGAMLSVISDPDDPGRALGIVYDRLVKTALGTTKSYVIWDGEMYAEMSASGQPLTAPTPHGLGRLPFVEIHRRARWSGRYWDTTSGNDLVAATVQVCLINALLLKLHRSQSHRQIWHTSGQGGQLPVAQILDEDSCLSAEGGQFGVLDLQSSPQHYLATKEAIETTVAANYGISRDRLNQKGGAGEDVALNERTAEIMMTMRRAELDLFEVAKLVSAQHPRLQLPSDATMRLDFGALQHRLGRKDVLEIRETEMRQGGRSNYTGVLEDNPEIETTEEARELVVQFARERAEYVQLMRALNVATDATSSAPGQSAQANGAMGPAVRDGAMSRDAAAASARQPARSRVERMALVKAVLAKAS